ncbi:hypothetical protein F2P81_017599 [Scophthalmus maximus]|uniref:Uncharacterized protein n=1 Tax=Scophthalmus maximus TaxID=52904 RepID=A0A6A4SF70_SCOMX|nr:hypothetical protein F2P81_017599 [Scophthalmus maximus]
MLAAALLHGHSSPRYDRRPLAPRQELLGQNHSRVDEHRDANGPPPRTGRDPSGVEDRLCRGDDEDDDNDNNNNNNNNNTS